MARSRAWAAYASTYREKEIKIIAGWIAAGVSGAVVGLPGCGRSNTLGFLCNRPYVVQTHLSDRPIALVAVDLNNLPANTLATLYRVMLRSFFRARQQFTPPIDQQIGELYLKYQEVQDPFLSQSALQDILIACQTRGTQVVLVINRFDSFCLRVEPDMVNTLRGLRDEFKDTLTYIVGMSQAVPYLPERERLGLMAELVDHHTCWVGAMSQADASRMVHEELSDLVDGLDAEERARILSLTGGLPVLLKAVCYWYRSTSDRAEPERWLNRVLQEASVWGRLKRLWLALTEEERFALSGLQRANLDRLNSPTLMALVTKGVCVETGDSWEISSQLLAAFVAQQKRPGRGRIWQDEVTGELLQGQSRIEDLTNIERSILEFLVNHPYSRHSKTDVIVSGWPEELRKGQGVSDNSLYQAIFNIRHTIETDSSEPAYLVNWRSKPEGGYQFFPEGRPENQMKLVA